MRGEITDDAAARLAEGIRALSEDPHLSLQVLCPDTSVIGCLLDLIMHQNDNLTEVATELLHVLHCGCENLTSTLHRIQLIVSSTTVRCVGDRAHCRTRYVSLTRDCSAYREVRRLLPELQMQTETSETWLGCDTPLSVDICRKFQITMRKFTAALWTTNKCTGYDAAAPEFRGPDVFAEGHFILSYRTVDPEHQQLMRNMGILEYVTTLMGDAIDMYTARVAARRDTPKFVHEIRRVFAHCYNFLRAFVYKNAKNAEYASAHMDMFLKLVENKLCGGNLLGDIIRYFPLVMHELRESFFQSLMEQIERKGPVPGLLSPLIAALECKSVGTHMQKALVTMVAAYFVATRVFADSEKARASILEMVAVPGSLGRLKLAFRDMEMASLGCPGTAPILRAVPAANPETILKPVAEAEDDLDIDITPRCTDTPQRPVLDGAAKHARNEEMEYLRFDVEPQPLAFQLYMLQFMSSAGTVEDSSVEASCARGHAAQCDASVHAHSLADQVSSSDAVGNADELLAGRLHATSDEGSAR